ncbi:MAG: dihydrofolate reductase family protein [Fimbriimonas sp.]
MRVTLFIATSLDGYIAGPDDDLSWLFTDGDYGFTDFLSEQDALVMGRGTYDVIRTFGDWPYPGKKVVVVSRTEGIKTDTPNTTAYGGELIELVEQLRDEGAEKVWLVGGGELVRSFLSEGLLDQIVVSLHPVLLGTGVPLFPDGFPRTLLHLEEAESYESGLVQITYSVVGPTEE